MVTRGVIVVMRVSQMYSDSPHKHCCSRPGRVLPHVTTVEHTRKYSPERFTGRLPTGSKLPYSAPLTEQQLQRPLVVTLVEKVPTNIYLFIYTNV